MSDVMGKCKVKFYLITIQSRKTTKNFRMKMVDICFLHFSAIKFL